MPKPKRNAFRCCCISERDGQQVNINAPSPMLGKSHLSLVSRLSCAVDANLLRSSTLLAIDFVEVHSEEESSSSSNVDSSTIESPFEAESTTESSESDRSPALSEREDASSDSLTESSLSDSVTKSASEASVSDDFSIDDVAGNE